MSAIVFRHWRPPDRDRCIEIFDANCPRFFAINERQAYLEFLERAPAGYEICEHDGSVVGAFGVFGGAPVLTLNWIMLDPDSHGRGLGSAIMQRILGQAKTSGASRLRIAASHLSAPFFERFGAATMAVTEDGWGPGMHRVDMEIAL